MAFFRRDEKQKEPAKPTIPEPWPFAKKIDKSQVHTGELPLGWYYYQDGYMWRGLKPDPETGKHNQYSPSKHTPQELEEWLGVPIGREQPVKRPTIDTSIRSSTDRTQIPDNPLVRNVQAAERGELQPRPSVRAQLQKPVDPPAPPTDIENRWAEEKLTEELKEIEQEIKDAAAMVAAAQEPAPEQPAKEKKKRKSLGRTNQVKTRLTDSELVQFQRRVKKSGLSQGDFLRSAALQGQIVVEEHSVADVAMLDDLAMIRAELGRMGGLLKMVIKPNEGQRELQPEEWAELIQAVRDLEKSKKMLSDLEVKVTHGNRDTQNEQERPVR